MDEEKKICGAKTRGEGNPPCKNPPVTGSTRCRMHGGTSPRGIAHYNFKDGRKSKYMPERMLEDLQAAAGDPELQSLREDITIIEARISDLSRRVDSGESGEAWKELQEGWREYKRLKNMGEPDLASFKLDELGDIITGKSGDFAIWSEIVGLMERKQKLGAAEDKRKINMHLMMDANRVMSIFTAFANIVRKHVDDPNSLRKISHEATNLLNIPARVIDIE